MHQTRSELIRALPLPRKGAKYVARAMRHNSTSVSVVVALRDILKLASTAQEVNYMIHKKMLTLNGKPVHDAHEPVTLFSILHADKSYRLTLLPTGRFSFEETKDTTRHARIIGKTVVDKGAIQYNLHDGTNVVTKDSAMVGDTFVIDFENKVKKHISLGKGKHVFVFAGRDVGKTGTVSDVKGQAITVMLENKEETVLPRTQVMVL